MKIIHVPGDVYSIQHYVIKFASELRQVCGFLRELQFPPQIVYVVNTGTKRVRCFYCHSVQRWLESKYDDDNPHQQSLIEIHVHVIIFFLQDIKLIKITMTL